MLTLGGWQQVHRNVIFAVTALLTNNAAILLRFSFFSLFFLGGINREKIQEATLMLTVPIGRMALERDVPAEVTEVEMGTL